MRSYSTNQLVLVCCRLSRSLHVYDYYYPLFIVVYQEGVLMVDRV